MFKSIDALKVKNLIQSTKMIVVSAGERTGQGPGQETDSIIINPEMTNVTTVRDKSKGHSEDLDLKETVSIPKMEFTLLVCRSLW